MGRQEEDYGSSSTGGNDVSLSPLLPHQGVNFRRRRSRGNNMTPSTISQWPEIPLDDIIPPPSSS